MPMSRHDYETVASVLFDSPALDGHDEQRKALAFDLAEGFCAGSPSFAPMAFLKMVDSTITEEDAKGWSHALRLRIDALNRQRARHAGN